VENEVFLGFEVHPHPARELPPNRLAMSTNQLPAEPERRLRPMAVPEQLGKGGWGDAISSHGSIIITLVRACASYIPPGAQGLGECTPTIVGENDLLMMLELQQRATKECVLETVFQRCFQVGSATWPKVVLEI
jgi:hypothetical protein